MKFFTKVINFIILLIFITNKGINYRCGTNKLKIEPKDLEPKFFLDEKDPTYKRKLDKSDKNVFKNFNIYVDKFNIEKDIVSFELQQYRDIIINSIDKAANTLQKLLKVKPIDYGYQFSNKDLKDLGIHDWDQKKFGDDAKKRKIDMKTLGIDLIIFSMIEEMDESTIAAASPIYTQSSNHQPIFGIIYINNKINFTKINSQKYLESTLIHEMTHILGFLDSFFEKYYHNIISKRDKYGIKRQYINSPKVVEVARKYFNCSELDGVELENYGDEGTAGSHWEARILLGDYMNGVAYTEEEVISEITLALLEDTGFYKPYYYTGGLMRFGKNKGCEFVFDKCVDQTTHEINPKFENEFFDEIYSNYFIDASCSSGRLSRTYNAWLNYTEIPDEYQYNKIKNFGGWYSADYCPVPMNNFFEDYNTYYEGLCSGQEAGLYGFNIIYYYSAENNSLESYTNKELSEITGEELSNQSFCFLSSLFKNNINEVEYYSNTIRATCYKTYCSERSLTIKINNDYIVCPRSGGKIKVDGYKGYFLCPDYNLMCSGTVVCNDLFECIDKKSEIKEESYIYDYEIKTSQNIYRAEESEADDINNYELSDDGVCPKYCKHCEENKKCLKCKEDYNLLGNINNEEIICEHKDILSIGYFKNENNIYYKCMEYCDECLNLNSCERCKKGIEYNYNRCINININNCQIANSQGICEKCNNNFAFNGTDNNFCIENEKFKENFYFTNDNGTSYLLCKNGITNCEKCIYNKVDNNIRCNSCEEGYFLSVDENQCILKEKIDKNKEYFYLDNARVKKCSDVIQNCIQCTSNSKCDRCIEINIDTDKFNYDTCTIINEKNQSISLNLSISRHLLIILLFLF